MPNDPNPNNDFYGSIFHSYIHPEHAPRETTVVLVGLKTSVNINSRSFSREILMLVPTVAECYSTLGSQQVHLWAACVEERQWGGLLSHPQRPRHQRARDPAVATVTYGQI